ncbi:ring-cleaving dioxygenase [Bacillus shivajii]|uniref:ring-cleaving dioxygenase n=1 Tax=Bacillus shivajii TaxID=1983719 RepID=UPI001CF95A46|nr:ring-cleaving dioxygenase [Bacillus shivajii]UCZ55151.1 ring-cleaving dioxygenase [Bacillus shivajii]
MTLKPLKGIHHVSAITGDAVKNYEFYTETLGMRLVKKTVNQDDTSMYHLFYADERGNPGTDFTFFEIPQAGRTYQGTNCISNTSLRVKNDQTLTYWKDRFEKSGVNHKEITTENGRAILRFEDFEGQRMTLVSDEQTRGVAAGQPWAKSPVPGENGITGLGPVTLTVSRPERTAKVLTEILTFKEVASFVNEEGNDVLVFETGEGGTGAEVHVETLKDAQRERPGRGSVHHVAFRVESEEELKKWVQYFDESGIQSSGFVERYYFKSLYFRESNGILFELATDGPGFAVDEPIDKLGESLALPPYLEDQRETIEAKLTPLKTK